MINLAWLACLKKGNRGTTNLGLSNINTICGSAKTHYLRYYLRRQKQSHASCLHLFPLLSEAKLTSCLLEPDEGETRKREKVERWSAVFILFCLRRQ